MSELIFEIEKDFQNTLKTWEEIKDNALNSNAPSLVYEEGDIIKRTLRDILGWWGSRGVRLRG